MPSATIGGVALLRDSEKRKEEYRRYKEKHGDRIRESARRRYHEHKNDPGQKEKVAERNKRRATEDREKYLADRRRWREAANTDPAFRARNLIEKRKSKDRRREALTAIAESAKSGGCMRCGERELICLDFHHRDPVTKLFKISVRRSDLPAEDRFRAEIAKCDVICGNCHWKDHRGRFSRPAKDPTNEQTQRSVRRRQVREEKWSHTIANAKRLGCTLCPEDDHACLQFHHVDPATKVFYVGSYRTAPLRMDIWLEIQKTMVLCVNCHRRVHAGVAALPDTPLEVYWRARLTR